MTTVLVAMSGGVDSSVAAWKIQQEGLSCQGATMKLFGDASTSIADAEMVTQKLGIPFHLVDFQNEFRTRVVDRFLQTYLAGQTPNPCVVCNRFVKFGLFLHKAQELGMSHIATGHYAQIEHDPVSNRYLLKKGVDETKDQSYVLYTLTQTQLAHALFPLGTLKKTEVRNIAEPLGFVSDQHRESQDLCFVPDGDYARFIEQYTGQNCPPGNFVDSTGKVLGKHKGLIRYTIGQRKGLGIAAAEPYYVCKHDVENNTVVLGSEMDLQVQALTATDINLIPFDRIESPMRCLVKVRYRQKGDWATVRQMDSDTLQIIFDEPQKGVALGQAAVLYDGGYVIGGGTIVSTSAETLA
ncbi:MAG: tRNA 2-thiouridine(34) synthase MnmA [Planctomycetaceae bacterium]|jgi:tRNA-specific 2-thiouridylase|nr:tRNA 2-thiouridine(34) synthase MnmA [Planctomycetaceae bacterium]